MLITFKLTRNVYKVCCCDSELQNFRILYIKLATGGHEPLVSLLYIWILIQCLYTNWDKNFFCYFKHSKQYFIKVFNYILRNLSNFITLALRGIKYNVF